MTRSVRMREWNCKGFHMSIYLVDFTIYQQGKDHQSLSMADMGFHKPGCLVYEKERQYLELTVREIQAYTKGGCRRAPLSL